MPRVGWVKPQSNQRLSDHVALGVLTRSFPPSLVDAAVEAAGKAEQRQRLLPARLVVYYVLALALFSDASYEEVMRNLVEGLSYQSGWKTRWDVPTKGAISQARARLGSAPLKACFDAACVAMATETTPGAFYRGLRLMAIDGTNLDVPDTPDNDEEFARPTAARGEGSAFPQVRLVGLGECGTHALTGVAIGAYTTGENTLALELVTSLSPGMLVLADRGFGGSYSLFAAMAATGAQLLWRVKSSAVLPALERFSDGSYRSELVIKDEKRRKQSVLDVRVVTYEIDDEGRPQAEEATYRLVTTIMDPTRAPASELAGLYSERWEFETLLDELKTHQRGAKVVLRSKSPDGVRQEIYGYLCTHYAIRELMNDVAGHDRLDPDRVSFTRSLRAARRSVRSGIGTTAHAIREALCVAAAEITRELLPERPLRAAARVVKRKMSKFGVKRTVHRNWPRPTKRSGEGIRILAAP
jgi:hypothetical protein